MGTIRIGTAGWDYPDWNGVVYPAGASQGFDKLAYLSQFVDVVELNASFYRPVAPPAAESWVRRTEHHPQFRFTAKALRTLTHEAPTDLRAETEISLRGLSPLRDAGRLGAVLLQFPQSFHCTTSAVERLRRTLDAMIDWPVVVEVRHASWAIEGASDCVRDAGAGWCVVDQPSITGSTAGPVPRATSRVGYLRLHGRRVDTWFRTGIGRDLRYDYLYSRDELTPLAEVTRQLSLLAEDVYVVQNNHFRGKGLVNALQMKHLLEGERPAAPRSLLAAYPALADVAVPSCSERMLF